MYEVVRVSPEEARPRVQRGEALLVCAYENPLTYQSMRLEGSISLQDFREMVPSLDRETEIIFYCA